MRGDEKAAALRMKTDLESIVMDRRVSSQREGLSSNDGWLLAVAMRSFRFRNEEAVMS
jgi:hypothetical protein